MISPEYQNQIRQMHELETKWGTSAHRWTHEVLELAKATGSKTLLDYGCGKGTLKRSLEDTGLTVLEYDPGIPGKDGEPPDADMVCSLDVLEHIEPEHLDSVIRQIYGLAERAVFLVIAMYAVPRKLPDGRGVHLIVEDEHWWEARLRAVLPPGTHMTCRKNTHVTRKYKIKPALVVRILKEVP